MILYSLLLIFATALFIVFLTYRYINSKPWPYFLLLYLFPAFLFLIGYFLHEIGYSLEQEEIRKLIASGKKVETYNDVKGATINFYGVWIRFFSIPVVFVSTVLSIVYLIKKTYRKK